MALSMDEQRILAGIEERLTRSEPGLAARMSAFGDQEGSGLPRSLRARQVASVAALVVLVVTSVVVYTVLSVRGAPQRGNTSGGLPGHPSAAPRSPGAGHSQTFMSSAVSPSAVPRGGLSGRTPAG
jgi:DUF3040 family protein